MHRHLSSAILLALSLALVGPPAAASDLPQRVPEVEWSHFFEDRRTTAATAVVQAPDGGYVYAGDYYLVKLDAGGNTQWLRPMSGKAAALVPTPDGGYMVTGETTADLPGYHVAGAGLMGRLGSLWVAKYSAAGDVEWEKAWGGSGSDQGAAIAAVPGGGYVVVGSTSSLDGAAAGNHYWVVPEGQYQGQKRPLTSMWVLRIDEAGTLLWQRFLGSTGDSLADAMGLGVAVTADGGYAVTGMISVRDGDRNGFHVRRRENGTRIATNDAYLVQLSPSGDLQWERFLGGSMDDAAHAVRATADGGYILAGYTNADDGDVTGLSKGVNRFGSGCEPTLWGEAFCRDNYHFDAWLAKLSPGGDIQWHQTFGGPYQDMAHDVIQTADGGYFFVGETWPSSNASSLWAVKLAAGGQVQWEETFGGSSSEVGHAVQQTADGGYVLAGYTISKDGDAAARANYQRSTRTAWVLKLSPVSLGPSAWAAAEVALARQYGLATDRVLRNYQKPITREEFSELAVRLYEALSGQEAPFDWPGPFQDSHNREVLKAYRLSIVTGMGEGVFAPDNPITREQIAVMFQRTLKAARPGLQPPAAGAPAFADGAQIAAWARAAVADLSARGIIGGVGDNRFDPQGTATREQALALVRRVYESLR